MNKNIKYIIYLLFAISISACKSPYTPTPITAVTNYLVVEGLINIADSTYISLSRTVNIAAKSTVKPELKAIITIESNQGGSYPLKELGNGVYAAAPLNLSAANQYRIRIKTTNGSTYVSDFNAAMVSPPVDSVTWKAKKNALEIYANTHDPKNATHYYRWDFTEAWEFHASFLSYFISDGTQVLPRRSDQLLWDCFTGDNSTSISLGTSVKLSQDVISQALVNSIDSNAEKISIKYTIQVKQYALTKDAYDYWTLLKKNTEQLGSVFDAQPSASIGNIHNINDPAEPVIGYISVGTITTGRIFITRGQLPSYWVTTPFYPKCKLDTILYKCCPPQNQFFPQNWFFNYKLPDYTGPLEIPVDAIDNVPHPDYMGALPICIDCTLRGSKTPPAYWK